jgi:hypothetical protein
MSDKNEAVAAGISGASSSDGYGGLFAPNRLHVHHLAWYKTKACQSSSGEWQADRMLKVDIHRFRPRYSLVFDSPTGTETGSFSLSPSLVSGVAVDIGKAQKKPFDFEDPHSGIRRGTSLSPLEVPLRPFDLFRTSYISYAWKVLAAYAAWPCFGHSPALCSVLRQVGGSLKGSHSEWFRNQSPLFTYM